VAGQVVDQLVLDIRAMPRYFPVIGRAIAARSDGAPGELASPRFGLDRYAWGGEVLTVKRMKVPSAWTGAPLRLVALGGGRFKLHDPEGNAVLSGQAGELAAVGKEGDGTPRVDIFVQELQARPGTEFMVVRSSYLKTVQGLSSAISITEQGKGTGILQLSWKESIPPSWPAS